MSAFPHHNRDYIAAVGAERLAAASEHRRRRSAQDDTVDLKRLLKRAKRGDQAAWQSIVTRFERRIAGYVRTFHVPNEDVEDVVQVTFLRLYRHIHTVRDANAIPAWLFTTARRESLRAIRKHKGERPLDAEMIENLPEVAIEDDEYVTDEITHALTSAVESLPKRQRALVRLLFREEPPTYEDISAELDMPIGSIGPTRGRALDRLRDDRRLVDARRGDPRS